jgi:sugar/nucleoside kinase (ribokinase family)
MTSRPALTRGSPLSEVRWPSDLVSYAANGSLGFFVGNGVSRLSGAPAWGDLFREAEVIDSLTELGVSVDETSYIELADILTIKEKAIWDGVLQRLQTWAWTAKPNHVHHILSHVLKPDASDVASRVRVLTSNIDELLVDAGVPSREIGYCHGEPQKLHTWIFSLERYWKAHQDNEIDNLLRLFDGAALLFVGYGHSNEDFDIARAVQRLSELGIAKGRLFNLMSRAESQNGALNERLKRLGIRVVEYDLPKEPTRLERELHLSDALLQLAQRSNRTNAPYTKQRQWCDEEFQRLRVRYSSAPIVMGLAAVNRHLQLNQGIPSGGRRFSMKAKVRIEPGGPGYIVSKILQAVGRDACLVSKIGADAAGAMVKSAIASPATGSEARIYPDFIDVEKPDLSEDGFRTWESFILEPNDAGRSHRVFIDRSISATQLALSSQTTAAVVRAVTGTSKRLLYFDKFFSRAVQEILQPSDPQNALSEDLWIVYETGSEGDRYSGGKLSPAQFISKEAYHLERHLSGKFPSINVVTASFRFARDYLARSCGNLADDSYHRLIHRHDSGEIVTTHPASDRTEDEAIEALLSDAALLGQFLDAVREGAARFLRDHPLRIVAITLHAGGCLIVPAGSSSPPWHLHLPGNKVTGRVFTASAGDVFRGVLVAALAAAQQAGKSATDVMRQEFWLSVGSLCNACAGIKVANETVEKALPSICLQWHEWQATNLA